MSIDIKVGGITTQGQNSIKLKLKIRKTIDGNIMIMDHDDLDIVVLPNEKKIITFPKSSYEDSVYMCQDRFFNFLALKGVIKRDSIQAGNVYGSLEASYPDAVGGANATQLAVFTVGKFIEAEKPHIETERYYDQEFEKSLTKPDDEDSTSLGEIPQAEKKGSIDSKTRRYFSSVGTM